MIIALIMSALVAIDEPVAVPPPPVTTPVPAAPPAPPPSKQPLPNGMPNLVSLFSNDDYPVEALRKGEQGTVGVRLMVTTEGRVGNCEIVSSSGSQVLDRATCDILQRRAKFTPARDQNGRLVVDYYTQRIRWEIPANISPFSDRTERVILRFDGEGNIVGCRFERDGLGAELPDCAETRPLANMALAGREKQARGMSLVIEQRFEANPSGSVPQITLGKRDVLIARGVIEFDIDPAGQSQNCKSLVQQGDATKTDLCVDEGRLEFEPVDSASAGARRGRISFASHLKPLFKGRRPER